MKKKIIAIMPTGEHHPAVGNKYLVQFDDNTTEKLSDEDFCDQYEDYRNDHERKIKATDLVGREYKFYED